MTVAIANESTPVSPIRWVARMAASAHPKSFLAHRRSAPRAAAAGAFAAVAAMFHARVRVRVSSWQEEVG